MEYKVTSENTKKMFASSLIKFLKKKSLAKITVKEIVADCGVNHKTFYYHFQDIYDLVYWITERESQKIDEETKNMTDYEDSVKYLLDYIKKNNYILNCLYDSVGKEQVGVLLYTYLIKRIKIIVEKRIKENNCKTEEKYKNFVCDFLSKALIGILIDWLKNGETLPEEKLIEYIVFSFKKCINALFEKCKD